MGKAHINISSLTLGFPGHISGNSGDSERWPNSISLSKINVFPLLRNWQIQQIEPKVMDKYELKMHGSINGVISALPRATRRESGEGIDQHLHICCMNVKLRAENAHKTTNYRISR